MSIFIATLAYVSPEVLATAKLAILLASLIAGSAGLLLLRRGSIARHSEQVEV
jgi:Na+/H+ antiporter NhaA